MTFPFLTAMMYNGPHFHVNNYSSYDLVYVSSEQVDENYVYSFNVENTGSSYIYKIELEGYVDSTKYQLTTFHLSDVFTSLLIGPYGEATVKITSSAEITDFSEFEKSGDAYSISDSSIKKHFFAGEIVESISLVDTHPDNKDCAYEYTFNFKEGYDVAFSCGLFEMIYEDKPVKLMLDCYSGTYHFYTREEIDLTKLKVEEFTLIEEYRPFTPTEEGMRNLLFLVIAFALVVSGVVFLVVFFFVRFLIKKNKKARAGLGL